MYFGFLIGYQVPITLGEASVPAGFEYEIFPVPCLLNVLRFALSLLVVAGLKVSGSGNSITSCSDSSSGTPFM